MRALVTGAGGQLGRALRLTVPDTIRSAALDHAGLDVADPGAVERELDRARPDCVINAAAFTAVDRAEETPEAAAAVNHRGARNLAEACARLGVPLIHVSTDYVFDGRQSSPYVETADTNPLCVYGRTKLLGERAVVECLPTSGTVIRTSWLYDSGCPNFVNTILRLLRERGLVRVVSDQVGAPTWARGLARVIWRLAANPGAAGIFHWTDAGVASWYDFAVAIREEAIGLGLLEGRTKVEPITTDQYPTPARRPAYSVLNTTRLRSLLGIEAPHWRENLRLMLQETARA